MRNAKIEDAEGLSAGRPTAKPLTRAEEMAYHLEAIARDCPHVVPGVTRYCQEAADARGKALEEAAKCAIDNQDCDAWEIAAAIRSLKDRS